MLEFRKKLQDQLLTLGPTYAPEVVTWDNHLHDVEVDQTPFVVINVRTAEKAGESEIGSKYDLYQWTVHIYYLAIAEDYNTGEAQRDLILSKIQKGLEEHRRLGNFEVVNPDGTREYVYDSNISAVLFDSSGQEDWYTFVSELYLNVYTAK